jgi:cysteine synthase A
MTSVLVKESQLLSCIGNTPLLKLRHVVSREATIYAKAEFLNPGGSVKDRIARHIVERAEERGELKPGSTILEVTSGNTGIALAMVGAQKGYRVVIIMPKTASEERRHMIRSYGAELELVADVNEIEAAMAERARKDASIYLPRQFENPDNPAAHLETTGREIIEQAGPDVDAFVMGVGTGGTLMGVAAALCVASTRWCRLWPWSLRNQGSCPGRSRAVTGSKESVMGSFRQSSIGAKLIGS